MFLNSRDEADKEFQECSELAQSEIKAFHQKRITEFRLALLYHTEVGLSSGWLFSIIQR